MKMPVLNIPSKGARFNLLCMMAALLTYMSMYAFVNHCRLLHSRELLIGGLIIKL